MVNKKVLQYSLLILPLGLFAPSFGMSQKLVFYGAKVVGIGTALTVGAKATYDAHKDLISFNDKFSTTGDIASSLSAEEVEEYGLDRNYDPLSPAAEKFIRNKLGQVGIANAQNVPIVVGNQYGAIYDKALIVDSSEVSDLERALDWSPKYLESYEQLLSIRSKAEADKDDGKVKEAESHLYTLKKELLTMSREAGLVSMSVGHEAKHMLSNDGKNSIHMPLLYACGVQACSSSISLAFNKIFKIQRPQTWPKLLLRSSGTVASIVPKLVLMSLIDQKYHRCKEAQADEFACEKAETIIELNSYRDFFLAEEDALKRAFPIMPGQSEKDRMKSLRSAYASIDQDHPYPGDRAADIQKHIDRREANRREGIC